MNKPALFLGAFGLAIAAVIMHCASLVAFSRKLQCPVRHLLPNVWQLAILVPIDQNPLLDRSAYSSHYCGMRTQGRPGSRNAVIYDQDELYDFANSGGSVRALIEEELTDGNRFIIMWQRIDGPAAVVMMLETPQDISRWENYRQKMRDWRERVLGIPPIAKNVDYSSKPPARDAHQIQRIPSPIVPLEEI